MNFVRWKSVGLPRIAYKVMDSLALRKLIFAYFTIFGQIGENLSRRNLSYSSLREDKSTRNCCKSFFVTSLQF